MSVIHVNGETGCLHVGALEIACTLGRSGVCPSHEKREGDGRTPLGEWPLRGVLLRPGKADPAAIQLPWRWVREGDGWSDDPADPAYNRPVHLPRQFSAESLLRDDDAYDVIVVLGHNDAPPMPGQGSAIFLHLSEGRPTAGCIAIDRADMLKLLPLLAPGDSLVIA